MDLKNKSTDELLAMLIQSGKKISPEEAVDLVREGAKVTVFGGIVVVAL